MCIRDRIQAVRLHSLAYPVKHGARVTLPEEADEIELFTPPDVLPAEEDSGGVALDLEKGPRTGTLRIRPSIAVRGRPSDVRSIPVAR